MIWQNRTRKAYVPKESNGKSAFLPPQNPSQAYQLKIYNSSEGEREARRQKEENCLNAEEWLNPGFQLEFGEAK